MRHATYPQLQPLLARVQVVIRKGITLYCIGDLREDRPLDASEFAVNLDQVRNLTAPKVYRDPHEFFARTYVTKSLGSLATEVLRRLSGLQVETSAVFNLSTQFGGGKTHSLTLLYHLARLGSAANELKGVPALLKGAQVDSVPAAAAAVFSGNDFDSISGRGGDDGTPLRKTPWGEIAFQLGKKELFDVVAEHDRTLTAPGGDVISRMLPAGQPTLILLDELMNYVSRSRKLGLGAQLHSFLHSLSEVARGRTNVVLAVSIPASEMEMSADDHADFERFKKILDRVGKAVVMSAEAETSEIIRRRLFEWEGLPQEAKSTVKEYSDWVGEHRDAVPQWFPADGAYQAFANTYPFHPMALTVFERKWRVLPRFQQTRGVLRLLALWVSRAFKEGFQNAQAEPLITLGTAPLEDALFRAAAFEQLGEQRLEGAVTTDIVGNPTAHALRLDNEAPPAVQKGRLHRKVATVIFFESNGGQQRGEATLPEVRLAVGEPGTDLASVDQCLEALSDGCYYLHGESGRYRFELKANLNKVLADRRATIGQAQIAEALRAAIKEDHEKGSGIERIFFPEKTADIPNRAVLALAFMGPDRTLADPGTQSLLESMAKECGQESRVFKSAVLWSVADDATTLREETRRLLAWEDILRDRDVLKFDDVQVKQVRENAAKARSHLKEAIWQAYRFVFLLDESNQLRRIDLGRPNSSAAATLGVYITGRLRSDDLLADEVGPKTLLRNWPPALPEWSTRAIRDAFFASPKLPRIANPDVAKAAIARGVTEGVLAYALKDGERYEPFLFKKQLRPAEVEISENAVVLRAADAEQIVAATSPGAPARPKTGERPATSPNATGVGAPAGPLPVGRGPETSKGSAAAFRWEGEVPWQKWSSFYNKVCSKFSTRGLALRVVVDVNPDGGISDQEIHEVRSALKDLGLQDSVDIKKT